MSATTKSMVLLAAMGLAACDSSNSNSSTPTPPAVTDPEIATLTRASAIIDVTAGEAEVDERAANAREVRTDFNAVSTEFDTASSLRAQMLAILGNVTSSNDLSTADRTALDELVEQFNALEIVETNYDQLQSLFLSVCSTASSGGNRC
ncbi:MAG: hypothetical protein IKD58_13065 [Loktanella sp.]|nr:hypothetical protein [Loktanella sp.]